MRKLSQKEKDINEINRKVKRYMNGVKEFVKHTNDGELPIELEASVEALEAYYGLFLKTNLEVGRLESLMVTVNNSQVVHPLLKTLDSVVAKLDMLMRGLGIQLREQVKLKFIDTDKPEQSPLEKFLNQKEVR